MLKRKNKNKEKSFDILKTEFNKTMKENEHFKNENNKNSKYISNLKTKSSENYIEIKILEKIMKNYLKKLIL